MATKEQYEIGATILSQRIRATKNYVEKMRAMTGLWKLRESQYRATGEERCKRLARNCKRAEEKFFIKAIKSYGLDDFLIKQYEWYSYRPKMRKLQERFNNGETLTPYDMKRLAKYEKQMRDEEEDRNCDI